MLPSGIVITEDKKEQIVEQRRRDAINALYSEWMESAEFTIDAPLWTSIVFDLAPSSALNNLTSSNEHLFGILMWENNALVKSYRFLDQIWVHISAPPLTG